MKAKKGLRVAHLGTKYGGWEFIDLPELHGSTILSCGLGEDASFDVEFATAYGAKVVIVDPTPRAVEHFRAIEARIGMRAESPYATNGKIDPKSYALNSIAPGQLILIEAALAGHSGQLRFYAPPDPNHVSYSLVNFQNDYSTETPFIEVQTVTFEELIPLVGHDVPLIKMDIEGAEIDVIPHILQSGIKPSQLLIEFDELNRPSRKSRNRFLSIHSMLSQAGYALAFHDGRSNFLYVNSSANAFISKQVK